MDFPILAIDLVRGSLELEQKARKCAHTACSGSCPRPASAVPRISSPLQPLCHLQMPTKRIRMRIHSGVRHSGSNSAGEHTKILKVRSREVATLSRFKE